MRRAALVFGLLVMSLVPVAAQNTTPPLIGWLRVAAPDLPPGKPLIDALAARGLVDGRDYRLVVRDAKGDVTRMPDLARSLMKDRPDIIVAFGPSAALAAKAETSTIPIVAASAFIEEGLAPSLARPQGNLTGVSLFVTEIDPKKLEVLKELIPDTQHVAALNDSTTRITDRPRVMAAGAATLGLQLTTVEVAGPTDFKAAFETFRQAGATALVVNASTLFATLRAEIGSLARRYQLPTICQWRSMVEAGCLASYGFPIEELFELIAEQVHKIMNGARPQDLPITQPRRFELVIDLKIARELGITIPQRMLDRADEVIE